METIDEKYKTIIQVSRQTQRELKDLKKDKETYNDVIKRLMLEKGV